MSELTPLREAVETLVARRPFPDFRELEVRASRRGRRRVLLVAVATVAIVAGAVLAVLDPGGGRRPEPLVPLEPVVGSGPVWFDAEGLHRGGVVEPVSVQVGVGRPGDKLLTGALALVRTGAVYLDQTSGDVWFHPWGGKPRVIGHGSTLGPGGDPTGDTAAWFDSADLVVFDTVSNRELARATQGDPLGPLCCEHRPSGTAFLEVSAERVVWASPTRAYSFDVGTGSTSVVPVEDVQDGVSITEAPGGLTLRSPGRPDRLLTGLEAFGRLSPSGRFLLAVELTKARHGALVVDTRTGERWRIPNDSYPGITWSYGDIAMVELRDGALLACYPLLRVCRTIPAVGPWLLPTG